MTEQTRSDRVLSGLFEELAAAATLTTSRPPSSAPRPPQRPAWTYPARWLPMDVTTRTAPIARVPWRQLGILALIGLLLAVALAAYIGSRQRHRPAPPFGPRRQRRGRLRADGDILAPIARWRTPSSVGRSRGRQRSDVLARRHEARLHAVGRRPTRRWVPDGRRCRRHERRQGRDGSFLGQESSWGGASRPTADRSWPSPASAAHAAS